MGKVPNALLLPTSAGKRAARLWRTVRYLRREQITGRLAHELRQRAFVRIPGLLPQLIGKVDPVPAVVGSIAPPEVSQQERVQAEQILRSGRIRLAGWDVGLRSWFEAGLPKLVRYHLHYLDAARELAAVGLSIRSEPLIAEALELIEQWQRENPLRGSEAWEPYAVAARLQNLVMVAGWGGASRAPWLAALIARHGRYLSAWPEVHLQGNHLLKDWIALAMAGLLLDGPEAAAWRRRGLREVASELGEQLLPDGGHYERSPMYHLLILSDLLDLRDLCRARQVVDAELEGHILAMSRVAMSLRHPDGDIPLFNDAVLGQAPFPDAVLARAGVAPETAADSIFTTPDFGLTAIQGAAGERLFFDTGVLGPRHQPGHAHSDTLSYELSVGGARRVVNGGVDGYQSPRRAYFRSAAAHNTVTVDDSGPDELWASFRVGGRSRLHSRSLQREGTAYVLRGELEAFQGWRQHRTAIFVPGRALVVVDDVRAKHPAAVVSRARMVPDGVALRFIPLIGQVACTRAPYAPRFGAREEVDEWRVEGKGRHTRLAYALSWGARDICLDEVSATRIRLSVDGHAFEIADPPNTTS